MTLRVLSLFSFPPSELVKKMVFLEMLMFSMDICDDPQIYNASKRVKDARLLCSIGDKSCITRALLDYSSTEMRQPPPCRLEFRSNQSPTFLLLMADTRSWMYCFPIPPSRRKRSAIGLSSLETFVLFPDPG